MNQKIDRLINAYCESEMSDFVSSPLFIELSKIAKEKKLFLDYDYGHEKNKSTDNFYLGISIINEKNEEIEIFDEGYLAASTILVEIDKKNRYKFLSWMDPEFISDVHWLMKELKKM